MTSDELQRLIRTAESYNGVFDGHTMAAAIALGFVTGARRGELCALRWSNVGLEARVVDFRTLERSDDVLDAA
ncbi:MAG: hypothetical protein M0Z93_11980 [Actinomycetota bacterium]|nr:hypothetical protein [Actinomycetota bacterium]